jgi:hypothetical protein
LEPRQRINDGNIDELDLHAIPTEAIEPSIICTITLAPLETGFRDVRRKVLIIYSDGHAAVRDIVLSINGLVWKSKLKRRCMRLLPRAKRLLSIYGQGASGMKSDAKSKTSDAKSKVVMRIFSASET